MWYDTLSKERQDEVKTFITKSKNPEKDPDYTRKYLNTMLKHAAIFSKDGTYYRLKAHTRENEHDELRKYLKETKATHTLEVGFAYGSSALVFAEHHQRMENTGISHILIDPNQSGVGDGHWDNIGNENLKRVGFIKGKNYRLIEETSMLALPQLFRRHKGEWLDVALIDGWHLFDYTLIDIFYCLEMLKVGGILIVDDKRMKAINAVSKYVTRAYPHVVDVCRSCRSILVLKKKSKDMRDWDADEKVNFDLK